MGRPKRGDAVTSTQAKEEAVQTTLGFLADLRSQVDGLCRELRAKASSMAEREATRSGVECRRYESGLAVEVWIETPAIGERELVWFLDMRQRGGGWVLAGNISWNGADVIQALDDRYEADFASIARHVPGAFDQLYQMGKPWLDRPAVSP
jgi:hypothetical protein